MMLALRFAIILVIIFYSSISHSHVDSIQTCSTSSISSNCTIECIGNAKCQHLTIQCADGSVCNVKCNEESACYQATINATNALSLFVTQDSSQYGLTDSNILCPQNGDCNIQCDGNYGCYRIKIDAAKSKSLWISTDTGIRLLDDATIICPQVSQVLSCGETRLNYLCSNPYTYRWNLSISDVQDITYSTCGSSIDTTIKVYNETHNLISNSTCLNGDDCGKEICGGRTPSGNQQEHFTMFNQLPAIYYVDIALFRSTYSTPGNYKLTILCNLHTVDPTTAPTTTYAPTNLPSSNPTFAPSQQETNNPSVVPTRDEGPNTSFTTITTNNTSSDTHDKESKSSINILALVISLIGLGIILCIAVAIREKWQDKKWEKELSTKILTEIQLGNTTIMYYTNNESISHQQQYIPPPINTGSVTPGIELVNITPFTPNDDAHSDDDSESQHEGSDHGSNTLLESIQTQGNDALPQKYEQKQETKNGEEEFLLNDIAKPLYHEKQKWELCLLHALNSLLQREEFTQKSLNNICKMLAPNKMINPHKALFGTGNYDANVLMMALNNINIQVQWFDARKANQIDLNNPLFLEPNDSIEFIGFILNNPQKAVFGIWSRRHWLSIKRINGKFYNLDSKLSAPKIYDNVDNLRRFLVNALTANNAELMICRKKKQNK